jgi:hypothetical protein
MVGNGCDIAVKSGAAGTRWPEFDAALAHLRAEDILVVWKRDGLSRSLDEIIAAIDGFTPEPGYHDKLRNRLCGCRPFCKRFLTFLESDRVRTSVRPLVAASEAAGRYGDLQTGPNPDSELVGSRGCAGFPRLDLFDHLPIRVADFLHPSPVGSERSDRSTGLQYRRCYIFPKGNPDDVTVENRMNRHRLRRDGTAGVDHQRASLGIDLPTAALTLHDILPADLTDMLRPLPPVSRSTTRTTAIDFGSLEGMETSTSSSVREYW